MTKLDKKIGFIGAGKMAQAIAVGLMQRGGFAPEDIAASARTEESLENFKDRSKANFFVTLDSREVVGRSDIIVLALKPQVAPSVVPSLRDRSAGKLWVSVMAGLSCGRIESWLHESARVVRCMPNTPVMIGQGMTAIAGGSRSTAEDLDEVGQLLEYVGVVERVHEADLDAVTAISGSGPAYVYHFIADLIQAGVAQGLSEGVARTLAVQTVLGGAAMVKSTGESPLALAAKVKSPNGTTVAACSVLEKGHWGEILQAAVAAARVRASELSSGFL